MAVFRPTDSPLDPMMDQDDDVNVEAVGPMVPPAILQEDCAPSERGRATVKSARRVVRAILRGADDRIVAVVGPCSIHDPAAAREYAGRLHKIAQELERDLLVVMRVYFEKPRTTVGWKGLINDPDLDGTFRINKGLRIARSLLVHVTDLGLPAGCEFLDTITPQFTADLVSWGAIGARTTESQVHRELSSGLSMPVGFKNGTDGNLQIAIDAVGAASRPHHFPGVTKQGLAAVIKTKGNPACHVILRGATSGPNYSAEHVQRAVAGLQKTNLQPRVMIDMSHGNSLKKHENQPKVCADICEQLRSGSDAIFGIMIESNLNAGNQKLDPGKTQLSTLKHGVSVTDACVDWDTTVQMLKQLAEAVRERRNLHNGIPPAKRPRSGGS
eukprot:TRINITY_DN49911_c0_g1_i1.p1 TRINITY_DN49911_c0_g1~~TRINITY_DN49911_c0_g1_i1.p1  ORF type:complete len:416 (+),score=137.14 TRINITY_DN49911_c0_g1_i1:94-1248(+)